MFGRMMVSALALMGGVAYAQETTPPPATGEATATPATPNPESTADRTIYPASFFAQYNPQTASDMVAQVPGFTLSNGDGRRGFSGAVGNLLIDGVRPTSKSQGVGGILSRIPANQVVRIEVLRGAAVAGDASGQSTLVNVVRTPNAGSGTWSTGAEYTSRQVVAPRGDVSYSGRSGQVEWGIGGSVFSQYRDLPGFRHIYVEPSDTFTTTVETPSPRDVREIALNGNLAFPLLGGRLSSTAQLDWVRFHQVSTYLFRDANTFALEDTFVSHFKDGDRQPSFEVGLNYDRDFGPWSLALVGLVHRNYYHSNEVDTDDVVSPASHDDITQALDRDTGESIFRASLSSQVTPQHRLEFGGEGAYNSLDQSLVFAVNGGVVPISNSNVLVEENRAEFFAVDTWRPNDRWTLESRIAWETSTLNFSGDTNDKVPLDFWKPSIQLSRNIGTNNQAHVRVYRDIGQLNFDDFVSAASISDQLIAGGNPELVPQTQWIAELGADWHFGDAALSLTLQRHWISDTADVVPLSFTHPACGPGVTDPRCGTTDHFDGPGNIGDATATSLDVNYSQPLNFLLPGAHVNIIGYWWDTDVVDPTTGQHRILSGRPETQLEVDFRQDISAWKVAWGINFFKQGETQQYRFNEIDTSEEGPWVDFFIETTALPNNMKLRLWAANFMNGEVHRDRRFFDQDLGSGSLGRNGINTSRDLRQRYFSEAPWLIIELSGTF